MAIINLTADSFAGDGLHGDLTEAVRRAECALEQGAHMLDVGAESTRPGAHSVSPAQELERVLGFIERTRDWKVPLSIDTVKPAVMRAALWSGAQAPADLPTPGDILAGMTAGEVGGAEYDKVWPQRAAETMW